MTPSELYSFQFQNPEPKFYTRVPNIIDHLTYDYKNPKTGKIVKKRLSIYAKELYRIIRGIAGECGKSWQNRNNLAEISGMSTGMVTKCKKELTQKFHQLDGNPLIIIDGKKKKTSTGKTTYHLCTIVDIWPWNNGYMATLKFQKQIENQEGPSSDDSDGVALSPHDSDGVALSPHDNVLEEALSPHDINKTTYNNISLSKEQQTPVVSVVSSNEEISVPPDNPVLEGEKVKAFNWFVRQGCDIATAKRFIETYSLEDLTKAKIYVTQKVEAKKRKNESVGNFMGYMTSALKNNWGKHIKI